jgi:hypothetical protein
MIPVFWMKSNHQLTKYHWKDAGKKRTLCGLLIPEDALSTHEGATHSGQTCAKCQRIMRIRHYNTAKKRNKKWLK